MRPTTNAAAWKAPDDWAVSPTESAISGVGSEDATDTAVAEKLAALALDLADMERETERMLAASPEAILRRLTEDDGPRGLNGAAPEQNLSDGRSETLSAADEEGFVCRSRAMEKQRWLLSAVYNMETIWDTRDKGPAPSAIPKTQKILALYEDQGERALLPLAAGSS